LTDLSQLVLAGKYHALHPMPGLRLSELYASQKSFEKMANFKYLVIALAKLHL